MRNARPQNLCYALKAGPMKDLAFAMSRPFAFKAGPMKDLAFAMSGPFALKAVAMKDLAFAMSGPFLYDTVFFHVGNPSPSPSKIYLKQKNIR